MPFFSHNPQEGACDRSPCHLWGPFLPLGQGKGVLGASRYRWGPFPHSGGKGGVLGYPHYTWKSLPLLQSRGREVWGSPVICVVPSSSRPREWGLFSPHHYLWGLFPPRIPEGEGLGCPWSLGLLSPTQTPRELWGDVPPQSPKSLSC